MSDDTINNNDSCLLPKKKYGGYHKMHKGTPPNLIGTTPAPCIEEESPKTRSKNAMLIKPLIKSIK